MSIFCVVGTYFSKAMDFLRQRTPILPDNKLFGMYSGMDKLSNPDYFPDEPQDFKNCGATAIYPLLNETCTDYYAGFKRNWALVCNRLRESSCHLMKATQEWKVYVSYHVCIGDGQKKDGDITLSQCLKSG
jgi:hypothetical protein